MTKGKTMSDTPKIGEVWHHDKYGDCRVLRDVDKDGDWLMEDSDGKGLYLIQDERHEWTRVDAPATATPAPAPAPKIGEVWHHAVYGDCRVTGGPDKHGTFDTVDYNGMQMIWLFAKQRDEWTRVDAPADAPADAPEPDTATLIRAECDALCEMLLAKNAAYGDSAIRPLRVFSRADPVEQIRVRLDDKLSRLARGSAAGEDVELDLLGYLMLLRVARRAGGVQ